MPAMIQIDRGKRIRFGEHVRDAVGVPGLHRRQRRGVVAPGVGILGAGMALRIERLIRRLLPAAVLLLRPPPHHPLRPLDQRRQSPRQLCQIALVRGRFGFLHDTPPERKGGELITAARRPRPFRTRPRRPDPHRSASPDQAQAPDPPQPAPLRQQRLAAAAALLPHHGAAGAVLLHRCLRRRAGCCGAAAACFGGGMRTRRPGPSSRVGHHRKDDDDLAVPFAVSSPKAP